jgi:hypothetical protein
MLEYQKSPNPGATSRAAAVIGFRFDESHHLGKG